MRRYFFDLIGQGRTIADAEGQEFAVADEARAHAVRVAAELGSIKSKERAISVWISVRDETGVAIFRAPVSSPPVSTLSP
jgi:hypothetical protein